MPAPSPDTLIPLMTEALRTLHGAVILIDERQRIVAWTVEAEALLGGPIEHGVAAPKIMCGGSQQRPIAEAMAEGRAVAANVVRPGPDGTSRSIRVRATPLRRDDGVMGYFLQLSRASELDGATERWGMWTNHPSMRKLFSDIERVGPASATVLVRGETGTGKELVARAIHAASGRKGPFRAINCAALPPHLLESALFGHVRGAFTGAVRDELGHFRLAEKGTLFLDEVAELSLDLQAKLLRVLQERTVVPVGGREPVPVDVRIVSATHRSLRAEVEHGRFRADLMYRIRVIPLFLPALSERGDDVVILAEQFIAKFNEEGRRQVLQLSEGAQQRLRDYDWPGNVRELQNAIEFAFVMGDGPVMLEADLPRDLLGDDTTGAEPMNVPDGVGGDDEVARLRYALERAGGHRGRAAASLGISRATLWRKMRKAGIE